MKKESTISDNQSEVKIEDSNSESYGFNHDKETGFEAIGLDSDSLDKNMEKFCDIMNSLEGGGTVSRGVEAVMKTFSYKEVCFLAFKGLEMANTLKISV